MTRARQRGSDLPARSTTNWPPGCCTSASWCSARRSTTRSPTGSAPQLLLLSAEDQRRDISLYINSPGGSVSRGLAIYDTMRLIPNDVSTLAMGIAASMGQFLLSRRHAAASGTRCRTRGS